MFHGAHPASRQPECDPEIPEVVVIALARNRIQKRCDGARKVFVDVRVGPEDWSRSCRCQRGDRPRLQQKQLLAIIDRPFDILWPAKMFFEKLRRAPEALDVRWANWKILVGFINNDASVFPADSKT